MNFTIGDIEIGQNCPPIIIAKKVKLGNSSSSIYEIMEKCSLNEKEELELKIFIESKGIIFIFKSFSSATADRLNKMNVVAFKKRRKHKIN